jgi:hypothetical protein
MCGEAQLEGCGDVRENFLQDFREILRFLYIFASNFYENAKTNSFVFRYRQPTLKRGRTEYKNKSPPPPHAPNVTICTVDQYEEAAVGFPSGIFPGFSFT